MGALTPIVSAVPCSRARGKEERGKEPQQSHGRGRRSRLRSRLPPSLTWHSGRSQAAHRNTSAGCVGPFRAAMGPTWPGSMTRSSGEASRVGDAQLVSADCGGGGLLAVARSAGCRAAGAADGRVVNRPPRPLRVVVGREEGPGRGGWPDADGAVDGRACIDVVMGEQHDARAKGGGGRCVCVCDYEEHAQGAASEGPPTRACV